MDVAQNYTVGVKQNYIESISSFPSLQKKKDKEWLMVLFASIGLLIFLGAVAYICFLNYKSRVYSHCVIEANENVTIVPEDFRKNDEKVLRFSDGFDINSIDTTKPGDYRVYLSSDLYRYTAILTVEDTIAPTGEPVNCTITYASNPGPEEFVKNVSDVEAVKIEYAEKPDFKLCGKNPVHILLTDEAGNETIVESMVLISPFRKEITIEAGEQEITAEDFAIKGALEHSGTGETELLTKTEDISLVVPGEYPVYLKRDGLTFRSKLIVQDTIAPVVEAQDFRGYTTSVITPESFIKSATDNTALSMEFVGNTNFKTEGVQDVEVAVTDLGGNRVVVSAKATLAVDKEAPVIRGVRNLTVLQGKNVSFKNGVTVTDNCDKDIALQINTSAVNIRELGTYPVTYVAVDRAGNRTEVSCTITVGEDRVSEAQVRAYAKDVLSKITTPEMSDMDKLNAIYWWVRRNMRYAHASNHSDWVKAAYTGFTTRTGDCYMYMSVSKALLDEAGIKNAIIDTRPLREVHFWNLVDIGEGWRHFDTVPRQAGGVFLYLDDATITAYSNTHGNSHIYDRGRFPGIS